ncbi:MAG: ABC transporter ATP-binding protein [Chloroflexi bacterium]|nr:MAG: ABC transporter ATP-binding protein [Chloroflexota bacterium]
MPLDRQADVGHGLDRPDLAPDDAAGDGKLLDDVAEVEEDIVLGGRRGRYGGQRQRIGLARALALSPTLIVADEPVSALDVSIRSQILNLMNRLQETHDLTYIVISHDLGVIRYVSDRIAVMYLGKLVEVGPSRAVYNSPAHPYTEALLSAVPVPDPTVERAKMARIGQVVRGELPSAMNPPSGCRFRTRCPRAKEICAEVEPPLRKFDTGQEAACHFPLQTPA